MKGLLSSVWHFWGCTWSIVCSLGSAIQEKYCQTGASLNRGLLRWWRIRRNTWNKERLKKLGFFNTEKTRLCDNLFAAFTYLLPVIGRRAPESSQKRKEKGWEAMVKIKCSYKFTVRTVKHWNRFFREADNINLWRYWKLSCTRCWATRPDL